MKMTFVLSLLVLQVACAHKQTEREVFAAGVREGFKMGHAPQILPIQIQPVSLQVGGSGLAGADTKARNIVEEFWAAGDEGSDE